MSQSESSFFERERDRLSAEITSVSSTYTHICTSIQRPQGFEELLSSSNVLNRKLEEVLGMTRENETIASLWQSFHQLMRGQRDVMLEDRTTIPGTGAHVVSTNSKR
jgi:DASH complex subunit DAD1